MVIGEKRLTRLTERIGHECVQMRDEEVAAYKDTTLAMRDECPADVEVPDCCAVMVDGGRHQQVDSNPNSNNHWYEYKAGICLELDSEASEKDPLPDVPDFLQDVEYVKDLTSEIGKKAADQDLGDENDDSLKIDLDSVKNLDDLRRAVEEFDARTAANTKRGKSDQRSSLSPSIVSREVVATQRNCDSLGWMMANRAWRQGYFKSKRKAFLGDGSAWIWTQYEIHFKPQEFVPILDLIHATTYVYASAMADRSKAEGSVVYQRWMKWVWEGNVAQVINELTVRQQELGSPDEGESKTTPRSIVSTALGYLTTQQSRMNYPEYRKQGLPITSAHMESTVKEINRRIKGTEKFWKEGNAEAILELKANTLCDSDPIAKFWKKRQKTRTGFRSCVGRRTPKPTPA